MKSKFMIFVCVMCISAGAGMADTFVDSDFVLGVGQTFSDNLIITDNVLINNHGTITGNISMQTSGINVRFINSGVISGNVDRASGVFVDQIVHSAADLKTIGNLSGHDILVETNTAEKINFGTLLQIAQNANEINIKNTSVVLDSNFVGTDINVKVTGPTIFYIKSMSDDINTFFTNHVSGESYNIIIQTSDLLFTTDSAFSNANVVRQTRYGVALGNDLGKYLDALRDENSNDKLLVALDSVDNLNDFNNVLSRSVRTHPIKMMDTVRVFNSFNLARDAYGTYNSGIGLTPFYVHAKDFDVLGANANFTYKISDDFLANFGLFGGNMRYAGPFDEFSGIIYGADFGAKYETSDVFARLQGMFTLVKFDDVLVFDGTNSVNNPTGIGTGMGLDLGPVFSVYDSQIKIKPFAGVNVGYVSITGDKKADVNAKIGLDAEFIKIIDGNKYGYGAKTFVQTDGAVYGGVFANMLSVADGVGGVLDALLLNDDNGLSYKVSLGINFIF